KDSTTYVSKQQQQQEWDAWVKETVMDEDEVIPEDETPELIIELQDVDKRAPTIFDYERMRATLNDALSNQFKNAEEYAYHLEQTTNFMENQIVLESRQEDIRRPVPRPLHGNTEEKKYILSLHKIHVERFPKVDLEEKMNRWIVKFCDATLEKVLKEVNLKIFQSEPWRKPPLLGELHHDILRAFKREITKRLSHREKMRRWESFVNGKPILPMMKRL
ncbi:hypothetical protein Tco_0497609, partial [Tanacetum coccineum]